MVIFCAIITTGVVAKKSSNQTKMVFVIELGKLLHPLRPQ